jgi:hypothetical protein
MKHLKLAVCVMCVALAMLVESAQAPQFPIPTTAAEVPGRPSVAWEAA